MSNPIYLIGYTNNSMPFPGCQQASGKNPEACLHPRRDAYYGAADCIFYEMGTLWPGKYQAVIADGFAFQGIMWFDTCQKRSFQRPFDQDLSRMAVYGRLQEHCFLRTGNLQFLQQLASC